MRCLLLLAVFGIGLGWLAPPMASAQIPDLEALERELERLKAEQARQEAEARRRQEAEARRRAEAEARRRAQEEAERQARLRWNQFERVSGGVFDRGQNVIWAAQDNGRDINWRDAQAHCRAMGSGWSLPSVAQLQSLYARDTPHRRQVSGSTLSPATNLIQFTGWFFWSAESRGSSEAWSVYLANGNRHAFLQSDGFYDRALCVRRP